MKDYIQKEFEKFVNENPYADSMELAEHFFDLGIKKESEYFEKKKSLEANLPKYYGDQFS